jgi:hypothetical protein
MSTERLEEMLADAGLPPIDRAELSELLAPLAGEPGQVPQPSDELAALFGSPGDHSAPAPRVRADRRVRPWRVRTATVGAVVLAVSSVSATGLSAAANSLPRGLQHHVSVFSRHYLPFDFPEPKKSDQPLGQGRFALSPETTIPHQDALPSGPVGGTDEELPQVHRGDGRSVQTGPFFVSHASTGADQYAMGSSSQSQAPSSVAPSPTASSPSASSSSSVETAGRPAYASSSPTPTSGTEHQDTASAAGLSGAPSPGDGEDVTRDTRPVKTQGKTPGKTPGKTSGITQGKTPGQGSGSGSGTDAPKGGGPGGGDVAADVPSPPADSSPREVAPGLPGLAELPDLPFAP